MPIRIQPSVSCGGSLFLGLNYVNEVGDCGRSQGTVVHILTMRQKQWPNPGDKQYGRLKGREFSQILSAFRSAQLNKLEIEREASRAGSKLAALLKNEGIYWWWFYELPFPHHIALACYVLGLDKLITKCAKDENPTRAFLDAMQSEELEETNPLEAMTPDGHAFVVNLVISMSYSLEAIGYYSLSINEMLRRAENGERRFLLQAVSIDRTVLGTLTASTAIGRAQLARENGFLSGLFKRAKGPHVARRTYVDLRFMRQIFADTGALLTSSPEELLNLVQIELDLYTQRRGDPVKGLAERFRMWAQEATTQK